MQAASRPRSWPLVLCVVTVASFAPGCDDASPASGGAATAPLPTVTLDASAVPADFVTHRHPSEDLTIRTPADWGYHQQRFRIQNDVLVGLFPPGSVPARGGPTRLYLHGHVLPDGVTFDQYVHDHEFGSFATAEGQTFITSERARLNGLPARRWVSDGKPRGGIKTRAACAVM